MSKFITVCLCIIAALCLWARAFDAGVKHVIDDGVYYIVDFEDADAPEGDTVLYIDIDDTTYNSGLYIG